MLSLLLAYVLTCVLVQQAQIYLIAKELRPDNRSVKALILEISLITLVFTAALVLSYRPFLASIITLALSTVFLVVNQAKYKALAEPLVFSDIYLYLQVFSHPRLFLPFLNLPLTFLAISIGLALLYLAAVLESALTINRMIVSLLALLMSLFLMVAIRKLALEFKLSFQTKKDLRELGFFNSLIIYFTQALQKKHLDNFKNLVQKNSPYAQSTQLAGERPSIIVIQSESFFDPRQLSPSIKTEVLEAFDKIKTNSAQTGKLTIPAWGANTLRSEYAFLSGLNNQELSYYRYNPYEFLQNFSSVSIASYLKSLGYRCICIHPNHSAFFKRDKVYPLIDFDEFIDIKEFDSSQTAGPYISDQAVYEKIQELLNKKPDTQALFIFAITMENHGPLHLESHTETDLNQLYQSEPPKQHHDLTIYLKHLKNADRMLLSLTEGLKARKEMTWLAWYGDHIPSMPAVYQELNWQDGRSEYLIWNNRETQQPNQQIELSIEQLGIELLKRAGFGIADKT